MKVFFVQSITLTDTLRRSAKNVCTWFVIESWPFKQFGALYRLHLHTRIECWACDHYSWCTWSTEHCLEWLLLVFFLLFFLNHLNRYFKCWSLQFANCLQMSFPKCHKCILYICSHYSYLLTDFLIVDMDRIWWLFGAWRFLCSKCWVFKWILIWGKVHEDLLVFMFLPRLPWWCGLHIHKHAVLDMSHTLCVCVAQRYSMLLIQFHTDMHVSHDVHCPPTLLSTTLMQSRIHTDRLRFQYWYSLLDFWLRKALL